MRVLTVITTVLLSLFLLACSATEVTESSRSQQVSFCDTFWNADEWMDSGVKAEFEQFAAMTNGEAWSSLNGLLSFEADWIGRDWHRLQSNDSTFYAWVRHLDSLSPLTTPKRISPDEAEPKVQVSGTRPFTIPHLKTKESVLTPAMFQHAESWKNAYLSLKERLFFTLSAPQPYTYPEMDRTWLTSRTSGDYLMLAYYASKAGKRKLVAKNILLSKLANGGVVSCNDTLNSRLKHLPAVPVENGNPIPFGSSNEGPKSASNQYLSISHQQALDSIRTMYIEQRLHQRVMWLAEQGLVKPLSAEEKKDWEALEKRYCSPVTPPCWIMGSETDGPVGYGRALEEEWEAGSGEEE